MDIVQHLRDRACPAGLPHTGDNPKEDHGHTDCWLHHIAADEIERLRALITEWINATADGGVMYQGITQRWWDAKEALREAVGR